MTHPQERITLMMKKLLQRILLSPNTKCRPRSVDKNFIVVYHVVGSIILRVMCWGAMQCGGRHPGIEFGLEQERNVCFS